MYSARTDYAGVEEWTIALVRAQVRKQPAPELDIDRKLWLSYLMDVEAFVRMGFPVEKLDIDTMRGLMAIHSGTQKAKGDMVECPNCGGLTTSHIRCDQCKAKMGGKGE